MIWRNALYQASLLGCTLMLLFGWGWPAFADHEPLNAMVITDQAVRDYVNRVGPEAEGLDVLPLSQAKPGGTVTYAYHLDPHSGSPLFPSETVSQAWFIRQTYRNLLERGLSGEREGALAEAFEVSADFQSVTFTMRRGVHWDDGVPFTAIDVLFSWSIFTNCIFIEDQSTGNVSLINFIFGPYRSPPPWSSDGSCMGHPAVLHETFYIAPGPNGILDSQLAGDDFVFGNRILPDVAPLSLDREGDNVLSRVRLDSTPSGDDVIIKVGSNQVALVWQERLFDPARLGEVGGYCCLPQHVLGESLAESHRLGDPLVIRNSWSTDNIVADPRSYVGTGPFRVESAKVGPGGGVVLVKNPFYWKVDERGQPLPKLDRLVLVRTANADATFEAFLDGQTDIYEPRAADLATLSAVMEEKNIRLFIAAGPLTETEGVLEFNFDVHQFRSGKEALTAAFRNPEFRRAFSQAINRQRHMEVGAQGLATPRLEGSHPFHRDIASTSCPIALLSQKFQAFCDAFQSVKPNVAFDPDAARAKLDAIGLIDRNADGVRDIPAGFGHILPGPDGVLDSTPSGDDFVQAGLSISGLGLSDRDGDGEPDPDPGLIQPGPNGVLETQPNGDDQVEQTLVAGTLLIDAIGTTDIPEALFQAFEEDLGAIGITMIFRRPALIWGPEWFQVKGSGEYDLSLEFRAYFGRSLDVQLALELFWCRSRCQQGVLEPFYKRVQELLINLTEVTEEVALAEAHAEFQLLQAANTPRIFVGSFPLPLGAVRKDRVNAPAVPFELISRILNSELLFRLDIQ